MWYYSFHDILTKNGSFIFLEEIHRDICVVYFNIFYHWVGSPFEYFELTGNYFQIWYKWHDSILNPQDNAAHCL